MDERCDKLLNDILDEANLVFVNAKRDYAANWNTDDYIECLSKLTNIIMSVKTVFALRTQPVFATVPEFSKEETK